jgi:hypothetical protein
MEEGGRAIGVFDAALLMVNRLITTTVHQMD